MKPPQRADNSSPDPMSLNTLELDELLDFSEVFYYLLFSWVSSNEFNSGLSNNQYVCFLLGKYPPTGQLPTTVRNLNWQILKHYWIILVFCIIFYQKITVFSSILSFHLWYKVACVIYRNIKTLQSIDYYI